MRADAACGAGADTAYSGATARTASARVPSSPAGVAHRLAVIAALMVIGLAAFELRDPLASMASYTAALMALNQIAPPLLLLGLRSIPFERTRTSASNGLIGVLLDPSVSTMFFVGLSIAVSLPGVFDPSLANALYAAPLGLLEFISGLLFWAQFMLATRSIRRSWLTGSLAWAGGIPMTVVALIWMLSPDVLYTPYLDVICRWDISPLVDQKWAGLVMFVAGMPLQLVGVWLLLGVGRLGRPDLQLSDLN